MIHLRAPYRAHAKNITKGVTMESINEQLFPSEFILDYRKEEAGATRVLTYAMFRFLSCAGAGDAALPALLNERLSRPVAGTDFSLIEDYLAGDYYFSPSFTPDSFEPFYLCAAIMLAQDASAGNTALPDELIVQYAPVSASLPYADGGLDLSALLTDGTSFYAALAFCLMHQEAVLPVILPRFTQAYRPEFHFTCEDFILFDFMDEYFEEKNCRRHPSFVRLIDTLVTATLHYYDTDFGTILEKECTPGASSRFAGINRCGTIQLPAITDTDKACHILAGLFRYAAVYELRNNLFDFHLEDDRLITLSNWEEKLRWHYVQYANVYQLALDSFHSAMLARILLKKQFAENLSAL